MSLPLCPLTDLPRLMCACCDSFSLTADEIDYLSGALGKPSRWVKHLIPARIGEYHARPWSEPRQVKVVDSANLCQVPHCTRPAGDAFVCNPCLDDLEVALGDVPALLEDLLILTMKQARFTTSGAGVDRSPLPYVPAAGDMFAVLSNAVTTAVRLLAEHRGIHGAELPADAAAGSEWLLRHIQSVAVDVGGPDIVAEIVREATRAKVMIDRPPDNRYIGLCDKCRVPMHAKAETVEHRCTTCGETYVVAEREAELTAKVRDSLLTVREIADLSARHLGQRLSVKQVEGMVRRGRLVRRGSRPGDGRHELHALYRAGDVLGLFERDAG